MCDETQNLNDTDSETFFRYQNFSRPILRLFSVPKFIETDSETFFGTKIFRDRFRDSFSVPSFFDSGSETLFRYQIFSIPVPRLFSVPNFFDSGSDTIKKMKNSREREFPGPGRHTLPARDEEVGAGHGLQAVQGVEGSGGGVEDWESTCEVERMARVAAGCVGGGCGDPHNGGLQHRHGKKGGGEESRYAKISQATPGA